MTEPVRLTAYSHGAGCGCKIAPNVLETILATQLQLPDDERLLVGNSSKDDAAVYALDNGQAVISTTDFFMPIVDDPFDFGRIAATNAISDIYAMGGTPAMAIAILGWPINLLGPEIAAKVVDGGRQACAEAGILLAGGHSIDAPEPIFGLAVTGLVDQDKIKRNDTAKAGSRLYLTKPLGVGILSTAQKQGKLADEDAPIARDSMCRLNRIGADLAKIEGVSAMTDVTGFALLGHLLEMCEGSGLRAELELDRIPLLPKVADYLEQGCVPGGTGRNFASYGHKVAPLSEQQKAILCDPQTSGGLLVAVDEADEALVQQLLRDNGFSAEPIGQLLEQQSSQPLVSLVERP
ncbi:selenide, water dikinase SelD [Motiliproteus coralliicola]|uniref:Selenide, water dikinase n=1 Tax=Motiliproteus coralliicola TaxID=2283196 RepID=A0A369WST7_9GAMM|nr:selenide, water dikinase SelD [Motiliproteus coralliicola]RDE24752.1 selenide, water dikinase SelD [Motiliproteus coralliicola]